MYTEQDIPTPEEALAAASTRIAATDADILLDVCIGCLKRYSGEELFVKVTDYTDDTISQVAQKLVQRNWQTRSTLDRESTPVLAISHSSDNLPILPQLRPSRRPAGIIPPIMRQAGI